jgi:hypothetical protein
MEHMPLKAALLQDFPIFSKMAVQQPNIAQ